MKKSLFILATMLFLLPATANDSMYYTSGTQLVPLQATDIRLSKEVLTITLCDDGFAQVDVLYHLDNQGTARAITMGFEANAPYMGIDFDPDGVHPDIDGFSVEVNGEKLAYRNALVRLGAIEKEQKLITLDPTKWMKPNQHDMNNAMDLDFRAALYNAQLDSVVDYAYAYYFEAHFKQGLNIVRHTYRYRIGDSVGEAFFLDYKLTPALRWQGGQIDDFTLVIRADKTFKHFFVDSNPFETSPVWTINGKGKQRPRTYAEDFVVDLDENGEDIIKTITRSATEFALRDAEVRFQAKNFRPKNELFINSGDNFVFRDHSEQAEPQFFYDPGNPFLSIYNQNNAPRVGEKFVPVKRILRNLPFAARGYVFKDKQLKQFFQSVWWYMPDSSYKADVSALLPNEQDFIREVGN